MLVDGLIVVLILMLIGSLPVWLYSRAWGYYGTSGIGVVLFLVGLLMWLDVI